MIMTKTKSIFMLLVASAVAGGVIYLYEKFNRTYTIQSDTSKAPLTTSSITDTPVQLPNDANILKSANELIPQCEMDDLGHLFSDINHTPPYDLRYVPNNNDRRDYVIESGKIYYVIPIDNRDKRRLKLSSYPCMHEIEDADISTFTVLGDSHKYIKYRNSDRIDWSEPSPSYAKDKNYVYANGKILINADPETFSLIFAPNSLGSYTKDKNNVYFLLQSLGGRQEVPAVVTGADPNTFVPISRNYAKDKKHAYKLGKTMPFDPNTFAIVYTGISDDDILTKDKSGIYFNASSVVTDTGLTPDSDTFKIVSGVKLKHDVGYAQDKNHVYDLSDIYNIPPSLDRVVHRINVLKDADSATFQIINNEIFLDGYGLAFPYYAKDKNNVYTGKMNIEGADPKTFTFYPGKSWCVNPNSVSYLDNEISCILTHDKQCVYIDGKKLTDSTGACASLCKTEGVPLYFGCGTKEWDSSVVVSVPISN